MADETGTSASGRHVRVSGNGRHHWTRSQAVRRSGWTVVDQGLSTLTNFALTIVIARSVDSASFGAFAVGYVAYYTVIAGVRGLVSLPLSIRVSRQAEQTGETSAGAGAAALVGVVAGLVLAVSGMALRSQTGDVLLVFGLL